MCYLRQGKAKKRAKNETEKRFVLFGSCAQLRLPCKARYNLQSLNAIIVFRITNTRTYKKYNHVRWQIIARQNIKTTTRKTHNILIQFKFVNCLGTKDKKKRKEFS